MSSNLIAQVSIVNQTQEDMHVVFLTALPGECVSETDSTDPIDNDGDSSPGVIPAGGSATYSINPGHIIASPRPHCCDHISAIHNIVPLCGYQASHVGQHGICDGGYCTPANEENIFYFNVSILNYFGAPSGVILIN